MKFLLIVAYRSSSAISRKFFRGSSVVNEPSPKSCWTYCFEQLIHCFSRYIRPNCAIVFFRWSITRRDATGDVPSWSCKSRVLIWCLFCCGLSSSDKYCCWARSDITLSYPVSMLTLERVAHRSEWSDIKVGDNNHRAVLVRVVVDAQDGNHAYRWRKPNFNCLNCGIL